MQAGDPHSPQPELKGTSLFTEQEPEEHAQAGDGPCFQPGGAIMKYTFVDKLATSCGLVLFIKCSYFSSLLESKDSNVFLAPQCMFNKYLYLFGALVGI